MHRLYLSASADEAEGACCHAADDGAAAGSHTTLAGGVGKSITGLKDVQKQPDTRNIPIDKVGVKGLRFPIRVLDRDQGSQLVVAEFNMYVALPHQFKGTHMSRFIEIVHESDGQLDVESFPNLLVEMQKRLDAESAHLEVAFPYFMMKRAPLSGAPGMMDYHCKIFGEAKGPVLDVGVEVTVPVTTLCPCSKEVSKYGAHNQRSVVHIAVRFEKPIWIEDLVRVAEQSASCEMYSILKRIDEKYVTERAYENPRFVEDMVRGIAQRLLGDDNVTWFSVACENMESIHNHNVYAYIERDKRTDPPRADEVAV